MAVSTKFKRGDAFWTYGFNAGMFYCQQLVVDDLQRSGFIVAKGGRFIPFNMAFPTRGEAVIGAQREYRRLLASIK